MESGIHTITPRRFRVAFPDDIPRYWADGSPFLTAILNTYTLLVPDNELYYIRTLRKILGRIDDPGLKKDLLAFFRQEGEHGMAHRRYWNNLTHQGFRTNGFVRITSIVLYRVIEPVLPLRIHVAIVAAIEHINALLARLFLSRKLLRNSDPYMRLLFEYHFAEEIEHKSVSFDVLHARGIGWALRSLAMLFVAPAMYLTFTIGSVFLLAQDHQLFRWRTVRDAWLHMIRRDRMIAGTVSGIARYCRPGFHPRQENDQALAEAVFEGDFARLAGGPSSNPE